MRLSGGCVGLIVMMIGNVRAARGVVVISGLCAVSGTGMQQRVGLGFVPSLTRLTRRRPRGRSLGAAAALASGQHDGGDDGELRHAAAPFVYAAHDMARFQEEYRTRGWVEIADFVPGDMQAAMLAEATELLQNDTAFLSKESHTVYQEVEDDSYPSCHPRNLLQQSSKRIVDFARLNSHSPLKELYARPDLLALVQAIASPEKELYRSACPYNAAYYNMYTEGDGLGWHFDRGEFGVNLILQGSETGGLFEYHHNTRSRSDPWAFDRVKRILAGESTAVNSSGLRAGSLVVFSGSPVLCVSWNSSMMFLTGSTHSAVAGSIPRINAILVFEGAPHQRLGEYSLRKFFGRELGDAKAA